MKVELFFNVCVWGGGGGGIMLPNDIECCVCMFQMIQESLSGLSVDVEQLKKEGHHDMQPLEQK